MLIPYFSFQGVPQPGCQTQIACGFILKGDAFMSYDRIWDLGPTLIIEFLCKDGERSLGSLDAEEKLLLLEYCKAIEAELTRDTVASAFRHHHFRKWILEHPEMRDCVHHRLNVLLSAEHA